MDNIFTLLSKSKTPEIILAMSEGLVNYTDIMTYIIQNYEHIAISTLNRRLTELHEMGLVEKQPKENRPTDYTYHPTEQLLKIAESLKSLITVNDGEGIENEGTVHKYRGDDLILEIQLPDVMRDRFEDGQKVKTKIFEFPDHELLLLIDEHDVK